jgi:hypothetical protein
MTDAWITRTCLLPNVQSIAQLATEDNPVLAINSAVLLYNFIISSAPEPSNYGLPILTTRLPDEDGQAALKLFHSGDYVGFMGHMRMMCAF